MAAWTGSTVYNSSTPIVLLNRTCHCQGRWEVQTTSFILPTSRQFCLLSSSSSSSSSLACVCAASAALDSSSSSSSSPSSSFQQQQDSDESSSHVELEAIASEEQFDVALALAQHRSQPIIVDWMAAWCRKCIYLKPKLEKLASEFQPYVKFYCVDVNAVPQTLVKRAGITKMPTIQLWKDGQKCDEVIGGHKAWLVIEEVREMLQKNIESS